MIARIRKYCPAVVLLLVGLTASGCVYFRLLELKRQIAEFDQNFSVDTNDGVRITCVNPVLLTGDIRWLGLPPESVKRIGTAEQWQVRWVKQLPEGLHEDGTYDIVLELLFSHGKLLRIAIPERYFAVMPKKLLLDLLRSLGGAKVNRDRRSVEAQLATTRPDLPGIQKLLGRPTAESTLGNGSVLRYRYVPATATGLAQSAVFDVSVHFDGDGQMQSWEAHTPVGEIGFNFTNQTPGT